MTCDNALELLSAALDGELSPKERAALDGHLAECEACAALFDQLAGQSRLLRDLDCEVPEGLRGRILASLPEQTPAKQRKVIRWQRWGTLAACLALVIWAGTALPGQLGKKAYDPAVPAESASQEAETAAEARDVVTAAEVTAPEAAADSAPAQSPAAYSLPTNRMDSVLESAISIGEPLPIHEVRYFRVAWGEHIQNQGTVITSPAELDGLLTRFPDGELKAAAEGYDQAWFDSGALIAVTLTEGSGSISHEVTDLSYADGVCRVVIDRQVPEVGTCDMAGWVILIETDLSTITQDGLTVILDH